MMHNRKISQQWGSSRAILHVDADAFFASVEQGWNPKLRGRPVIVGGLEDQRGCVHTASYEARRMGVTTAMSTSEARRLCPSAIFLKGDFRQYWAAGETMRRIYESITPLVEQTSLDDAYLDLTGLERHGPWTEAIRHVKEAIRRRLGISVSVGMGTSKLIARMASGQQKPDGLTIVPPGAEGDFLSPLPVRILVGIGPASDRLLQELGITTIGQLADLSKRILIQFFGRNGETIWRFANGMDSRPVGEKPMVRQISRETSFDEDTGDDDLILGTLSYLTERIGARLREKDWVCRVVRIRLRYAGEGGAAKTAALPAAAADGGAIFAAVERLFEGIRLRRSRLRLVGVRVTGIDRKERQGSLFTGISRVHRVNSRVDGVRDRFGFTSVMPAAAFCLKTKYTMKHHGYVLHAPSLSQ